MLDEDVAPGTYGRASVYPESGRSLHFTLRSQVSDFKTAPSKICRQDLMSMMSTGCPYCAVICIVRQPVSRYGEKYSLPDIRMLFFEALSLPGMYSDQDVCTNFLENSKLRHRVNHLT